MNQTSSVHIIKATNENRVLMEVLKNVEFTKREISETTGLTFPTVSRIADDMEARKLLRKKGYSSSVNGRKASLYQLNPDYAHILIIYFQHDRFFGVIASAAKENLALFENDLVDNDYIKTLDDIIADQLSKDSAIEAISIGVPGSVVNGEIRFIESYGQLKNVNLKEHIEEKFRVKTVIERDMNALMGGILRQKEYEDYKNLSVAILTTDGPGVASMVDGKIIRGFSGFAGEVGYLPVYDNRNLQNIAEAGFAGVNMVDYTVRLILCMIALINPEKIILIKNDYSPADMTEVISLCRSKIPESVIPVLEISSHFHRFYREGLIDLGRELIVEIS